jgi:homoserine dehydrogenase
VGIENVLKRAFLDVDESTILVDTTASDSEEISKLFISCLDKGAGIVMANKKIIAGPQDFFRKLMTYSRVKFESTVGAGTPFIEVLQRICSSGDNVRRIKGALSGTLGFISSELGKNRKFSEIIKHAKSLGYTEPDPRQDLSGLDVARKALILARICGMEAELSDVSIERLYPSSLDSCSIDQFTDSISQLDQSFAEKLENAKSSDQTLRYIADIDLINRTISVGFSGFDRSDVFASLSGTDNLCTIETDIFSVPLSIRGSGAGASVTAIGCLGDIVQLSKH